MQSCDVTLYISSIACAISKCSTDDEMTYLAACLNQLSSTLTTIVAHNQICAIQKSEGKEEEEEAKEETPKKTPSSSPKPCTNPPINLITPKDLSTQPVEANTEQTSTNTQQTDSNIRQSDSNTRQSDTNTKQQ